MTHRMTHDEFVAEYHQREANVEQKARRLALAEQKLTQKLTAFQRIDAQHMRDFAVNNLEYVRDELSTFVFKHIKELSTHPLAEVGDRFKAGTMSAGGREPSTTINDAEKM